MKQNLLNKLWLRVWMIVAVMTTALAGTAQADTKTFDFKFETIGSTGWSNSYAAHQYEYTEGTVKFTAASKQTQTISTMPVTKGQPVEFVMKEGYTISAATFNCKQWGSKAQTITLHYSTDGGENYTSTDVTSSNFVITSSELPEGTNAVKITFNSTSNQVGIESLDLTYSTGGGGSSAVATTTTIDASGITNTDVYEGTEAGSLSATVADADNKAVEGASVTWSGNNDAVATIDEGGNVTLVAAGTVKFTAAYAGVTDEYFASSATYEMTVTDSTPFTGGDVTFAAAIDLGTSPLTKNGVIFECSNGALNNGSEYRLYKNSETTFSLSDDIIASGYLIKSIAFTCTSTNPASGFTAQEGWVTDGNNGTWTGAATSVSFTASNAQVRATEIVVTVGQAAALSSITLSGDYPTTFHVGDTFSHEGIVVTATYEDATTKDVTASAGFTGYDMATAGAQTVTVRYTEGEVTATATYDITVNAPATLLSISLSGDYPTEFEEGDAFSSEGIVVTANFDDNTTANVTAEATFTGYDMSVLGEQTVTVSYEGQEATYTITVVEKKGTETNPYTVAEAIAATPASGTSADVYIHGIVSAFYGDDIVSDGTNYRYYVSDDGTTDNQLLVYKGNGLNNVAFSSADDLQIGDEVVILGGLTLYRNTPEVASGNYIVSLVRVEKPAAPTFSVAEGTYTEAQSVELSTATEGATIYYTIDGTEPTAESTVYAEAIVVTETTTIKAIAVKDDVASEVATATYTINTTPSIDLGETTISAPYEGLDGTIDVTYNNLTDVLAEVQFVEADGTTPATYSWVAANIDTNRNIEYIIEENTSTDARTAYMKVYAVGNEGDAYSELITITQAGYVVDYATLPFVWTGGTKEDLLAENGVTAYGLGSDYAASNAPYRVKLDGTGDYIQVKTDCQPVIVSVDVKMLGGSTSSTITVQESADGETFTDVEELSISGSTNTILYLQTVNAFDAATRYIRLYFTKGSNVGIGGIAIEKAFDVVSVGEAGYATYVTKHNVSFPSDVKAYITSKVNTEQGYVSMAPVTAVPKGTPVVLKKENGGNFTLAPATAINLDDVSANELKASDTDFEADGTQYVLAKPQGYEIGFYKAEVNSTIKAGKAYLEITGEAPVKGFTFKFGDDATSINEELRVKSEESSIYNLAGQRVSKMQRGINIVNGKKLLK